MARIVIGSYMVRYPLGGNLSWTLQWLVGFQRLGHEVYLVEKSGWPDACYDPCRQVLSDDPSYGIATVYALLKRFGLEDRWTFVDARERYYGLSRERIESIFRSADLFLDIGSHGLWMEEAAPAGLRVLVDGEPGYTQIHMEHRLARGGELPEYDGYFTNGANIGTPASTAPTAGREWRCVFNPVVVDLFDVRPSGADAPFTTVMNWQSHDPVLYQGVVYGQKDVEFARFVDLPRRTSSPMEIAVDGRAPKERLQDQGWRIRSAQTVTISYDSYREYLYSSRGEFGVCKNVFVATRSGWFSDRSAAYLASGRPVVLQDTGFPAALPCGQGLFAVSTVEEAAAAIEEINAAYTLHTVWARDLAREYLDARVVLTRLLRTLGL